LEQLSQRPSTLVQDERAWSIYVSAEASEIPSVIYGIGVDPSRVSIVESESDDLQVPARSKPQEAPARSERS
jgi:hypothetical protein